MKISLILTETATSAFSLLEIQKQHPQIMTMFLMKTVILTKICSCVDGIKKIPPMLYSILDFL
ncbi:predicted protein [Arabidopsis lyrata subsp. lyrata]|uniref:Predicted protein n=1 Tax=Arabidopsis lyrata subsp. lyrata TaxID=81972 RepID=D7KQX9_ARALL|nr:predicted protein [Arabidopsis lyrata subsp. lyrata]